MADHPTSIRLPDDIKLALDRAALEQRRDRTFIILEILRQWMQWVKQQKKKK